MSAGIMEGIGFAFELDYLTAGIYKSPVSNAKDGNCTPVSSTC
jgi:hypothetical protein